MSTRTSRVVFDSRHFLPCLLLLAVVWHGKRALAAEELPRHTPAEQFVLEKIAAGEVADLSKSTWGLERDLHSHFLEKLLTGQFKTVHWRGVRIRSAIFAEPLDLNWADVPFNVALMDCQFQKPVYFRFTRFAKGLSIYGSKFQDAADFSQMKVSGELDARGVEFQDKMMTVHFEGMEVAHHAQFGESVFNGPADFTDATIGGEFVAYKASFLGGTDKSDGTKIKTTGRRGAIFNVMKVGTVAYFANAIFSGPADFAGFNVGTQLLLSGAKFNEEKEQTHFQFLRAGILFANGVLFAGPVEFLEARIGTLRIDKAQIKGKEAHFDGMHVERLQSLDGFSPKPGHELALSITGMTYQQLGDETQLSQLIEHAKYNRQNYTTLEAYFKTQGKTDAADDVFVHMKRRERGYLRPEGRLWGLFIDALVRYGRAPQRVFYLAAGVVLFGIVVFSKRRDVQAQRSRDENRPYDPFWYSLDLLVPAIDLQAASVWMPNQNSRFRRNYARVHRILGWVLIPIGLAAVSGLIR